jgi:hypothetical protein
VRIKEFNGMDWGKKTRQLVSEGPATTPLPPLPRSPAPLAHLQQHPVIPPFPWWSCPLLQAFTRAVHVCPPLATSLALLPVTPPAFARSRADPYLFGLVLQVDQI